MRELEDLYKEIILDHYRRPRHKGTLEGPSALKARGYNPLCGDEVDVSLILDDGVARLCTDGKGCAISQASLSMMTELVDGKSLEEIQERLGRFRSMLDIARDGDPVYDEDAEVGSQLGDAEALESVRAFPSRIKCATLGWNTLEQALAGGGDFTER